MRKVWTARVGSAGNWRIVGEQDEMGPGKRREPSIATKEMVNVGSSRAVVNQFFPADGNSPRLANVFDVTGNSVIGDVTGCIQGAIVVPVNVSVGMEGFGDNRAVYIGSAVDR